MVFGPFSCSGGMENWVGRCHLDGAYCRGLRRLAPVVVFGFDLFAWFNALKGAGMSDLGTMHPPIEAPLEDVETERLMLRRFVSADLDPLAQVFEKPEVWRFPYGHGFSREETADFLEAQIHEWDECGFGCWLALEKGSRRVIGYVGISVPKFLPEILPAVEVGWRFDPDFWGQGFATEGARAALRESFDTLGLDEVCSVPQAGNPRSGLVCERLGMTLERTVSIPANSRRGALEAQLYKMTRTEWETRARKKVLGR